MLAGVMVAAVISSLVGRIWPAMEMAIFGTLTCVWVISGLPLMIRVMNNGRESVFVVVLDSVLNTILGIMVAFWLGYLCGLLWPTMGVLLACFVGLFWTVTVAKDLRGKLSSLKSDVSGE